MGGETCGEPQTPTVSARGLREESRHALASSASEATAPGVLGCINWAPTV